MKPVLFLDSGIGGIPYCRYFHRRNPGQSIVYLADRLHFPYGSREKEELAAVLIKLVEQIIQTVNPCIIVVACNTATLAALAQLREHFPALPFVGTVPAVKPAALASKTGKIGVLGTELTINESYIRELAAQYASVEIVGVAAPELVEFVESRLDSAPPEETREIVRRYVNRFRTEGVDAVVLGCTHFLFLEEDFRREAAPGIAVFESVKGIAQRIESLLAESSVREENAPDAPNRLLLTGTAAPEPSWAVWAERLGLSLALLNAVCP
ncbi:MAG: glutamate racemase [Treponema sp.]|jgi:glutamate racemase|nr:glutamate racemase [Treponema sp.]